MPPPNSFKRNKIIITSKCELYVNILASLFFFYTYTHFSFSLNNLSFFHCFMLYRAFNIDNKGKESVEEKPAEFCLSNQLSA